MTSSNYLAMVFGTYIIAVSIPMLWDQSRLIRLMKDFIDSPPLIFLTGILALIGGLSIIAFHNIWVPDWRSFITIIGWIAAIEGAWLIIAPGSLIHFANKVLNRSSMLLILGFVYLGGGLFLLSRALF